MPRSARSALERNRFRFALLVLLGITALATGTGASSLASSASSAPAWQTKVDPWLLSAVTDGAEAEFLVLLQEQADLRAATTYDSRLQRGRFVVEQLRETARRSQQPLLAALEQMEVEYRSYWVANMVWVHGDMEAISALALRPDVAHIYANPHVQLKMPAAARAPQPYRPQAVEWNIEMVGAPDVWAHGVSGEGIVIGGQDTGYDWQHPALINQYRGAQGATVDHNYSWHDAIHDSDGVCGEDALAPCDDHGHGTHTMGTMVGDDGGSNKIGMAPQSSWIGCRNMDDGVGTPATYSECFQWFMAPTDLSGQNPDVSKAPHVINNSWSCPRSEGCTDPAVLQAVVQNVQAAGIVVVSAAGNRGPYCGSVDTPPAIYEASFSVGATNSNDGIAAFSSRGPVTIDGSNRLKPNVVAPGVGIRSSLPGGAYGYLQGTSMASPHVAGLVALLISANPELQGDVDAVRALIEETAVPLTTSQSCGDLEESAVPNHTYGHGRIDALAAYEQAIVPATELPFDHYFPVWIEETAQP